MDFSKQFQALVNKYNERDEKDVLRSEVLEGFSDEMIALIHALQKEKESFGEMGIDLEEKSFYDILKALAHKYDFDYPEDKLIKLAKEVKTVVDDKAKYTDWSATRRHQGGAESGSHHPTRRERLSPGRSRRGV